jgi:hypothetical protein
MSKKVVKFDEDDLKVIFGDWMPHGGFLGHGEEIVGFTFKTRPVKKGGDYYEPINPGDEIEEIRYVQVHVQDAPRKRDETEDT